MDKSKIPPCVMVALEKNFLDQLWVAYDGCDTENLRMIRERSLGRFMSEVCVVDSFSWENSPEGYDFWNWMFIIDKMNDKMRREIQKHC